MARLSGDQNGKVASSVPAIGVDTSEPIGRSQSWYGPVRRLV